MARFAMSDGVRRLAVGCSVAAVVAVTSGTAHAVDNLPPKQPLVQDLQSGYKPCATGDDKAYVSGPPTLSAVLYDPEEDNPPPEANQVQGEFEAWWTDSAGVVQRRTYTTLMTHSRSSKQWRMPADIPANTVVSWHVRANDGKATSAWSSEGGGAVCQFVYDDVSPEKAVVTSTDYPEEKIQDGVGVYGSFTMDSPSPDVVEYRYNFIGASEGAARPEEMGGPATIRFLPLRSGTDYLSVRAIDRSGRSSGTTTYFIRVKDGRAPVAHWKLADAAGSTSADAETGTDARAGSGVTFAGAAPDGTDLAATARFDGSDQAFLTSDAPAVDTDGTFAVSAWVRPDRTDRDMTVVSQGTDTTGVTLGLSTRDASPTWSFTVAGQEVSGGAPKTGEWAHVLGLHDAETGLAQLYVNGLETGTKTKAAPAATSDAFRIGQGSGTSAWDGDIGDVRAHDRVVVPTEITALAYRKGQSLARWSLETASDGTSPEQGGGSPLKLGGGASIYRVPGGSCEPELDPDCPVVSEPLVGDGHLRLDGETGYAATEQPAVNTSESFTVGVVVRLADSAPDHPMTVLSQAGEHTDAFKVRYEPSEHAWQLVMPEKDEAGAPETVVAQTEMADGGQGPGSRIAVVYDDATDRIQLYVNGSTNAGATADFPNGWHSSGPLQVGRAQVGDGWGEYLHGDVDEVQVYRGALRAGDIPFLGTGVPFLE